MLCLFSRITPTQLLQTRKDVVYSTLVWSCMIRLLGLLARQPAGSVTNAFTFLFSPLSIAPVRAREVPKLAVRYADGWSWKVDVIMTAS